MTSRSDRRSVRRRDLDADTADRMLDGRVAADDAPPAFAPIAALIATARGIHPNEESVDLPADDADFVAAGASRTVATGAAGRWSRRTVALTVTALCLTGAVGAAAATGAFHRRTTQPVTSTSDRLGQLAVTTTDPAVVAPSIGRPSAVDPTPTTAGGVTPPPPVRSGSPVSARTVVPSSAPATSRGGSTAPTERSRAGLCNAYAHRSVNGNSSQSTTKLAAQAAAAGQTIDQYCGLAVSASTAPPAAVPTTAALSPGKSGAAGPPGQAKKAEETSTTTLVGMG